MDQPLQSTPFTIRNTAFEVDRVIDLILNDQIVPEKEIKALIEDSKVHVNYRRSSDDLSMFTALAQRGNLSMMSYLYEKGANHFGDAMCLTRDPRIRGCLTTWIEETVKKLNESSDEIKELHRKYDEVVIDFERKENRLTFDNVVKQARLDYIEKEITLMKDNEKLLHCTTHQSLKKVDDLKMQFQREITKATRAIDGVKQQLRQKHYELNQCVHENNGLKQQLHVNNVLKEQLQETKCELEKRIKENSSGLKQQLQEKDCELEQRVKEISGLKQQLQHKDCELEQRAKEISGLKQQLQEKDCKWEHGLKQQLQETQCGLDKHAQESGLKQQLQHKDCELEQRAKEISGLKQQLQQKDCELEQYVQESVDNADRLKLIQLHNKMLTLSLHANAKELGELKQHLQKLQQDRRGNVSKQQSQNDGSEQQDTKQELKAIQEQYKDLKGKYDNLKEDVDDAVKEIPYDANLTEMRRILRNVIFERNHYEVKLIAIEKDFHDFKTNMCYSGRTKRKRITY